MKTINYEQFKFRKDNRNCIDQAHVKRLIESIRAKNLLELRPILVNKHYEVIDGQHRLEAAKELGVEIYYNIEEDLTAGDIITLNINKQWTLADFLNFYVQNGYDEYIKFKAFMDKNAITARVALNLCLGTMKNVANDFRHGKLVFEDIPAQEDIELCKQTIACIKKNNGKSNHTESGRFWKAMLLLIKHDDFRVAKWFNNLDKMVGRICPKVSTKDYARLLMDIYNWKNSDRINILDEV